MGWSELQWGVENVKDIYTESFTVLEHSECFIKYECDVKQVRL